MTAYLLGPKVAHVMMMEYSGMGRWQSLCSRGPKFNYHNWALCPDTPRLLLHYSRKYTWASDQAPTKPWCKRCVAVIADDAHNVGLIP